MLTERTSAGLDVHAPDRSRRRSGHGHRSAVETRLRPDSSAIKAWLAAPPAPVAVIYQARHFSTRDHEVEARLERVRDHHGRLLARSRNLLLKTARNTVPSQALAVTATVRGTTCRSCDEAAQTGQPRRWIAVNRTP